MGRSLKLETGEFMFQAYINGCGSCVLMRNGRPSVLYFFDPEEGFCQPGFFNPGVWEQTGTQLFRHVGELNCAA